MYKVKKTSKYRTIVNSILALSYKNCYPIPTYTEVRIDKLLEYKNKYQLSMNALLTKLIADTIKSDQRFIPLNSIYQSGFFSNKIIYHDHVSFSVAQDKMLDGEMVASTYELKNVDSRSLTELDNELKKLAKMSAEELPAYQNFKFLLLLPTFILKIIAFMVANFLPASKMTLASIGFSNIGQGAIQGFFPMSPKTLMFGIGTTTTKVIREENEFKEYPFLQINMTFNHYVVDGMLCNHFLNALKNNIETMGENT